MFAFVEFLKKRPTDRTILMGRIIFGLTIALILGLNLEHFSLHLPQTLLSYEEGIKYGLFILAIVPIFMGATNVCMAKRKYIKMIQMVFGVVLIIVGNWLIVIQYESPEAKKDAVVASGSLDYASLNQKTSTSKPLDTGFWIALLGVLPLLAGITGKCITSKCLKYGEVIKKIRV